MTDEAAFALLVLLTANDSGLLHPVVAQVLEAAGIVAIPPATAKAIDSIGRRMDAGAYVTDREISDVLYAVAACSPDDQIRRVYA
jgi:hypothetical protein